MRKIYLEEYKDRVILYCGDPKKEMETLELSYREAFGLFYALEKIMEEPAFKYREPSPRKYNLLTKKSVTTPVVIESEEEMWWRNLPPQF